MVDQLLQFVCLAGSTTFGPVHFSFSFSWVTRIVFGGATLIKPTPKVECFGKEAKLVSGFVGVSSGCLWDDGATLTLVSASTSLTTMTGFIFSFGS